MISILISILMLILILISIFMLILISISILILILIYHILTIIVLAINFDYTNTYNTIYYYLQICCHNTHNNGIFIILTRDFSGFGGLEVVLPKFAGSNPAETVGFFRAKKILRTPSFGGEVKPLVPCRRFTACKRFLNAT